MNSNIKKLSYAEFTEIMTKANERNEDIEGVIVYREDAFVKPYSVKERSYVVSSCCKLFHVEAISTSLFGDCLDGHDLGVRLDLYNWGVEYCYILDDTESEDN